MRRTDLTQTTRRTLVMMLVIGLALLVVPLAPTLLLIFAAVLIAVLIRSAAMPFRAIGFGNTLAVLFGFSAILVAIGLFGWLFGAEMSGQFVALERQLETAVPAVREALSGLPLVGNLEGSTPDPQEILDRAANFAFGLLGLLTNLVLVFVGAAYFALEPDVYQRGVSKLFPKDRANKVIEAMEAAGSALRRYLLGQLLTMSIVGIMVWIGLEIVGVPSAAALGLTIGVANFIPLIGPFIGAIPGLIIAFAQSPDMLIYAGIVYLVAQQIEGNVLTPMVQNWAVSIPPAVLIFALAALGTLFGVIGVILAAPLAVVLYTLVMMLWTRDTLGYDIKLPGRKPIMEDLPIPTKK